MLHDLVPYLDLGPDHFTNRLGKSSVALVGTPVSA